ncbi:MAG: PAS-domain containing protein, partial [Methylobacteriaceae bacterium]
MGLGNGQDGRETVGGHLLRTGSGLCLTVAGFAATALIASLSAEPTLRLAVVGGAAILALVLVCLILRRLTRSLTRAMQAAESIAPATAPAVALRTLPACASGEAPPSNGLRLIADRPRLGDGADPAILTDIAALKLREDALSDRIARLNAALDTLSLGFLLYDRDHRLLVVNRRYHEIYRLPPGAVTPGMSALEVLRSNVGVGDQPDRSEDECIAEIGVMMGADAVPTQIQHLADGRVVAVEIQPIAGGGFVAIYEEATERWNAENRIAHMARHDAVTDLPNRVLLRERIEGAITRARRETGFAVLCLDLDNFKQVNDTLGHA